MVEPDVSFTTISLQWTQEEVIVVHMINSSAEEKMHMTITAQKDGLLTLNKPVTIGQN